MTKKAFIALANTIREHNEVVVDRTFRLETADHGMYEFEESQLETLADFCQSQNPRFKRQRWLDYIAGKCGPNGGKV